MRIFFQSSTTLVLVLGLALLCLPVGNEITAEITYVDLDGDGFDDNVKDVDSDGIPDHCEAGYVAPATDMPTGDIFAGLGESTPAPVASSSVEIFALRNFNTRGIASCRFDFEADFSAGLGVAVGGRCVGGVCY
jgi:hypothetical protein